MTFSRLEASKGVDNLASNCVVVDGLVSNNVGDKRDSIGVDDSLRTSRGVDDSLPTSEGVEMIERISDEPLGVDVELEETTVLESLVGAAKGESRRGWEEEDEEEEDQEDEQLDHVTHIRKIRRLATNSIH